MAGASAGAALVALYVGGAAFAVGFSLAVGAVLGVAWGALRRASASEFAAPARSR